MRRTTEKERQRNDCEDCLEYVNGFCTQKKCPYKVTRARKPTIFPSPVFKHIYPLKAHEKYNIKTIMGLEASGMSAVEISEMMNIKPQVVADIIKIAKKGDEDAILQNMSMVWFKSRPE